MGAELEGSRRLADLALKLFGLLGVVVALAGGATTVTPVTVGLQPCAEIGAYGSLWVADYSSAKIVRVDPATNKVTGSVNVGVDPCGLAAGAGAIWVDGYGTNTVERIDPVAMRRVKRIPTGPAVWDVAFDGRYVWADDNGDGTVLKIDPATNKVVRVIHTGGSPTGLAVSWGSLWVGSNGAFDRTFFRISLATGKLTRVSPPSCLRPAYFAVADGVDPWVTCVGGALNRGHAIRLDPATNKVTARVTVGHNPGDGAIANGDVWVPNKFDGTVTRIDATTGKAVETIKVGGSPFVVNEAFGDVWVPDNTGTTVSRLHLDKG